MANTQVKACGGTTRIEDRIRRDRDGVECEATAEDAYTAWFVMDNGCTASHDTAYCAAVPMPSRVTIMGSHGSIEVINDKKLVIRRMVDVEGLSAEERIRRGLLAGEGDEVIEFNPAPGEAHEPSLLPWFGQIKAALESGEQIRPSFDDGVAIAEAMDLLRANAVAA